ncbi:COP9 signalosome complex subunit 5a-like [Silene latifolia]|uniref:COP9 signalosome complex subunit 5a-like n=1 Tax=Silene latifolia TaxID=37657 RepID=UPI003D77ECE9
MDSATAKKKFEHLNNITTTLYLNSLDDCWGQVSQQDDPIYLQRVVMSDVALLKMVKHTSSNNCIPLREFSKKVKDGRKDLGGLFKGKVCGDAILVMDACVLPLDDNLDFHTNLLDYFETQLQTGGLEDVVGWYRTSAIGDFPTEIDISTQMRIQKLKDLSFALIIDAGTTIDIVKVFFQAFRTYPEGYTQMNRKRDRPDLALEVDGAYSAPLTKSTY